MTDQTRRTWLITIGGAAVGVAVPVKAFPAPTLPPGVYQASADHLSHALMNGGRYHPIPGGCPTDYVLPRKGPYEPLFFSEAEFKVILRLTELLLGETEAIQETAEWIDLQVFSGAGVREAVRRLDPLHRALAAAYHHSEQEDPATVCRDGLSWLERHDFMKLATPEQTALLESITDTPFFKFLKAAAIRGFYTSQAGLKELDFKGNAFYARSPGCQS